MIYINPCCKTNQAVLIARKGELGDDGIIIKGDEITSGVGW